MPDIFTLNLFSIAGLCILYIYNIDQDELSPLAAWAAGSQMMLAWGHWLLLAAGAVACLVLLVAETPTYLHSLWRCNLRCDLIFFFTIFMLPRKLCRNKEYPIGLSAAQAASSHHPMAASSISDPSGPSGPSNRSSAPTLLLCNSQKILCSHPL